MPVFTDQIGRTITLERVPERIVSLVPSQTELLYDLGLGENLVGITKFCIHPEEGLKNITKIGGTKNPKLEKIHLLQPDLIIANKEENRREDIAALEKEFPESKVLLVDGEYFSWFGSRLNKAPEYFKTLISK